MQNNSIKGAKQSKINKFTGKIINEAKTKRRTKQHKKSRSKQGLAKLRRSIAELRKTEEENSRKQRKLNGCSRNKME